MGSLHVLAVSVWVFFHILWLQSIAVNGCVSPMTFHSPGFSAQCFLAIRVLLLFNTFVSLLSRDLYLV